MKKDLIETSSANGTGVNEEIVVGTIEVEELARAIQSQRKLTNLLDGSSSSFIIVDVRDVDHKGEHIVGSRNIPYFNKEKALNLLREIQLYNKSIEDSGQDEEGMREKLIKTVIFHCFYCTIRGPQAAQLFSQVLTSIKKETVDANASFDSIKDLKVKYLSGGWAKWKQTYSKKNPSLIQQSIPTSTSSSKKK